VAELTTLEEKLAEALGLAQAAGRDGEGRSLRRVAPMSRTPLRDDGGSGISQAGKGPANEMSQRPARLTLSADQLRDAFDRPVDISRIAEAPGGAAAIAVVDVFVGEQPGVFVVV
jgi:hypothetical protein